METIATNSLWEGKIASWSYVRDVVYIVEFDHSSDLNLDIQPGQYLELVNGTRRLPMSVFDYCKERRRVNLHLSDTASNKEYFEGVLPVGKLKVEGPKGTCTLKASDNNFVYIAFGMGITQINFLLNESLSNNSIGSRTLYWFVKDDKDLYLNDLYKRMELKNSQFKFIPILTGSKSEISGKEAFKNILANSNSDFEGAEIYLSGGRNSVQSAVSMLLESGLEAEKLNYDKY